MSENVAVFMLERLHEWGVKRIYGYPGDGINGLMGRLPRRWRRGRVHPDPASGPEVPPLPPHIRFEQAKKMAGALAAGDRHRGRIVKQSVKGKLEEFINR